MEDVLGKVIRHRGKKKGGERVTSRKAESSSLPHPSQEEAETEKRLLNSNQLGGGIKLMRVSPNEDQRGKDSEKGKQCEVPHAASKNVVCGWFRSTGPHLSCPEKRRGEGRGESRQKTP